MPTPKSRVHVLVDKYTSSLGLPGTGQLGYLSHVLWFFYALQFGQFKIRARRFADLEEIA